MSMSLLSNKVQNVSLNIIITVHICGILTHAHMFPQLYFEIMHNHSHFDPPITRVFLSGICGNKLTLPIRYLNEPLLQVCDVDIDSLPLMTSRICLLREVGRDVESAVRDQEPRVSLLHQALDGRLAYLLVDL